VWCRTLDTYLQFMWRIKLYQEVEETCLSSLVYGPSVWTNNHLYRRPAKPDYQYKQVSLLLCLWKSVSKHVSWVFFWRFFGYSGSLSIQGVKKIAIGKIWKLRLCRIIWTVTYLSWGRWLQFYALLQPAFECSPNGKISGCSSLHAADLRLRLEISSLIFEWSDNLSVLMSYMSSLKCWNLYSFIPVWNLWCFLDLSAHPILPLTSSIFMYCNLSVHGEGCYLMITILGHYLHSQIEYLLIPVTACFLGDLKPLWITLWQPVNSLAMCVCFLSPQSYMCKLKGKEWM
jgi:hypothetical protein